MYARSSADTTAGNRLPSCGWRELVDVYRYCASPCTSASGRRDGRVELGLSAVARRTTSSKSKSKWRHLVDRRGGRVAQHPLGAGVEDQDHAFDRSRAREIRTGSALCSAIITAPRRAAGRRGRKRGLEQSLTKRTLRISQSPWRFSPAALAQQNLGESLMMRLVRKSWRRGVAIAASASVSVRHGSAADRCNQMKVATRSVGATPAPLLQLLAARRPRAVICDLIS